MGFLVFLGGCRLVTRVARGTTDTYVTAGFVAGWFAPMLVSIAAGYHPVHSFDYVVDLVPAPVVVAVSSLSPPMNPSMLAVPAWFSGLRLAPVILGHPFPVRVVYACVPDLLPGHPQPLRSEHPLAAVTVGYTMADL